MTYEAKTLEEYIAQLPEEQKGIILKLRATIKKNLSKGFKASLNYKMLGYYITLSLYPKVYDCAPKLPFLNIASQKNTVNLYRLLVYTNL